jgi:hypothetical protein
MSTNNFHTKLQFNDIRNVNKKEIGKLAIKKVKKLKNSIQAKNTRQILFNYRFGSMNKGKKKEITFPNYESAPNYAL